MTPDYFVAMKTGIKGTKNGKNRDCKTYDKRQHFHEFISGQKYLIQLYWALHPEDTEITGDELKDITIKNIMVEIMILTKAQTTWIMNIIIRALIYLAQSIKKVAGKYKLEENDAESWVRKYWKSCLKKC